MKQKSTYGNTEYEAVTIADGITMSATKRVDTNGMNIACKIKKDDAEVAVMFLNTKTDRLQFDFKKYSSLTAEEVATILSATWTEVKDILD